MMKKILFIIFWLFSTNALAKKVTIFACEPEWGALAREITKDSSGRDKVEILVATRAAQNPYLKIEKDIPLLQMIMKADVIFCSGGGLEELWLPEILKRSSGVEMIMAADYVKPLSSMVNKKRYMERVHLDPNNLFEISKKFLEIINKVDARYNGGMSSSDIGIYNHNYEVFTKKLKESIIVWNAKAKELKNVPVVVRNDTWAYLTNWLGLKVVAKIENEDGSKKSTQELVEILQKTPAKIIIFADFEGDKSSVYDLSNEVRKRSGRNGARAVFLPFTVGGLTGVNDIFSLYEATINKLIMDCSQNTCADKSRSVVDYFRPDQTIVRQGN